MHEENSPFYLREIIKCIKAKQICLLSQQSCAPVAWLPLLNTSLVTEGSSALGRATHQHFRNDSFQTLKNEIRQETLCTSFYVKTHTHSQHQKTMFT